MRAAIPLTWFVMSIVGVSGGCGGDQGSAVESRSIAGTELPAQDEFADFRDVPYVWAQDRTRFDSLWERARTETIRIAVFGDSQETSPEGAGYVYVPRLNYEAWLRYGNSPETQVAGYGSYGGGSPYGEWLLSGSATSPGASTTRVSADRLLPGIWVAAHSTTAGDRNVNGEWYGQLTVLRQDAISVTPLAQAYSGVDYFCAQSGVRAEVFAATHPQSGEVRFQARPIDDTVRPDYYAPVTSNGAISLGLAGSTHDIRSGMSPLLSLSGHRYLLLEVSGSDDRALTDIVGVRSVSESCRYGMVFQDFAAGGYTINAFLANHSNAGALFKALGFHAAIIHLGANDAGHGVSAVQHKEQLLRFVALVREWVQDAAFPVVLMTDVYRDHWPAIIASEYDRFAGVHWSVAKADANVLIVNSRRLMDDRGWTQSRPDRISAVLVDDVHYSPQGARELAAAEIQALLDR